MVGHFLGAVVGHVAHGDAGAGGGGGVDRVEAHAVAHDHAAVGQLGDEGGVDLRPVPEDDCMRREHLGGDWGVEIQHLRPHLGHIGEIRHLDRGMGVGEAEFFGADDDDERLVHENRFDRTIGEWHG